MRPNLSSRNFLIHLAGWLCYFALHFWIANQISADIGQILTRTFGILFMHMLVFYVNLWLLMPVFFERKRYFYYILGTIALLILASVYFRAMEFLLIPEEIRATMEKGPEAFHDAFREGGRHSGKSMFMKSLRPFLSLFSTLPILFVSTLISYVEQRRKKEKEEAEMQHKLLEAETSLLKFQINPHFLFNTLNNIYSLSIMKSDKTPDSIQLLSEMLRYVIYNSSTPKVTLKQEMLYIQSYIDLQLLKDDQIENVKYALDAVDPNLQIAPMVLIPFVENSFKHSKFEDTENGWINIRFQTKGEELEMVVRNSKPKVHHTRDVVGGIGLANVKRRLELLYPGKHYLYFEEDVDYFEVKLRIYL